MERATVVLRRAGAKDWQSWRELRLQALSEAPYAFGSTFEEWQDAPEQRWRDRLTSVPFNAVAYASGKPAGMVSVTQPAPDGTADLISMWVAPFARGRGIGDAVVQSAIAWARERGAARVLLAVREANANAIGLYRRNGFHDWDGPAPEDSPCERFMVYRLS